MIRRKKVKVSTMGKLSEMLTTIEAYSVESIADKNTMFVATDDEFAIIRHDDAMVCNIDEMPILAEKFIGPIKREILDLYEDIKDLNRMQLTFAVRYTPT